MNIEQTIKDLNKAFEDDDYKQGWIANIAMTQLDNEHWYRKKHNKVGKYLNTIR